MATTLYFTGGTGGGDATEKWALPFTFTSAIDGGSYYASGATANLLRTSRGNTPTSIGRNTVAGPTAGLEFGTGTFQNEWTSGPVAADVTISGTITLNLWASETSMSANVAINCIIEVIDCRDGTRTVIAQTARTTEVGTSAANNNFTVTPTSTLVKRGDRIVCRVWLDDGGGTMASGFSASFYYNGNVAGTQDSNIVFTETITFEALPSGQTLHFKDDAASGSINPGSATEKEVWTTANASRTTAVTNGVAGPTAGVQVTKTAGGTALEWYTRPLAAVTVGGIFRISAAPFRSAAPATMGIWAEIAVVDSDGTNPTVIGIGALLTSSNTMSIVDTAEGVATTIANVGVRETAIADGRRLRFRFFFDDPLSDANGSGFTFTLPYNGSTSGNGLFQVQHAGTLTEYAPPSAGPASLKRRPAHRFLVSR